jgi:hypothetical protein
VEHADRVAGLPCGDGFRQAGVMHSRRVRPAEDGAFTRPNPARFASSGRLIDTGMSHVGFRCITRLASN